MKLYDLIHRYEIHLEHLRRDLPQREKWGHGPHDLHEIAMTEEFLESLRQLTDPMDPDYYDPENPPETNDYVLLHFDNFDPPLIGRYEGNEEYGGNYFIGDDADPAIKQGIIVDGWMYIPGYEGHKV